jgi:hypothetical protein
VPKNSFENLNVPIYVSMQFCCDAATTVWLVQAARGGGRRCCGAAEMSTALMADGDEIISGFASSNFPPFEG